MCHMETLHAIIERVRRHGKSQWVEPDFDDDDESSSSEEPELNAVDVCAEALCRYRTAGASAGALDFLQFAITRGAPRPAWRAIKSGTCDVRPEKQAHYEVTVRSRDEERTLRVSTDDFLKVIAILYVASFRVRWADIFTSGKTEAEIMRNYALATRCVTDF
jgi:hypothetical protein